MDNIRQIIFSVKNIHGIYPIKSQEDRDRFNYPFIEKICKETVKLVIEDLVDEWRADGRADYQFFIEYGKESWGVDFDE